MKYTVIIEKGDTNFGAFVPDLPGCIATGDTKEETLALIQEAMEFHIECLKEDGVSIAAPRITACNTAKEKRDIIKNATECENENLSENGIPITLSDFDFVEVEVNIDVPSFEPPAREPLAALEK